MQKLFQFLKNPANCDMVCLLAGLYSVDRPDKQMASGVGRSLTPVGGIVAASSLK